MEDKKFIFESDVPNDSIDIYSPPEIKITKLKPENDLEFRIEIEGHSVDNSIVNALRRTIMSNIPIYAFHRSNVFIESEKSRTMYNNDLIYNLLETLPIFDIPNNFDLEDPEIYLSTPTLKSLFGTFVQHKYANEEKIETLETIESPSQNKKVLFIELSVNIKNNTKDFKFVNTHDAVLKIDGKITDSYLRQRPISILVLKPTEEISFRAEANLGIEKMYASYESTTNVIFDKISSTKYHLWYETLGQLDNETIFSKACIILYKKLENLKKYIENKFPKERSLEETIEIQLHGENHTIGNLLSTILKKCQFVEMAAYYMPHPFIDKIVIAYKLYPKAKIGPIQVFVDCLDYLVVLFKKINTGPTNKKSKQSRNKGK